jgi:RNA polymerase sigma-70 factor (ECF subfamily)
MVSRVMREVPARHRDVLVLRYYREMSSEEMADVLGCSVTAAKVRLHRARRKFRECYERLYQGDKDA